MLRQIKPRHSLLKVSRTPVLEADERQPHLCLDKNENLGLDPHVIREMRSSLTSQLVSSYPDYSTFYKTLAGWLGCRVENVLITAGSDSAIKLVFESYLEEGDRFVLLTPSFAMYEVYGLLCGGHPVKVPFRNDLSIPVDRLLHAIDSRTKIVAIASPNNPTGTVIDEQLFLEIVKLAQRFGALVLIDEAYYFFTRKTLLPHVLEFNNVVLTRTFSKACGLAALRLGFAYGHPSIIRNLRKCQPIFEVNSLAVKAAAYLIKNENLIWNYARDVELGKDYLARTLPKLGVKVHCGHGNFVLIDLMKRNTEPVVNRLKSMGVRVGSGYSLPALSRCIKVTAGPVKVMRKFTIIFRKALENK